MARTVLVTGSAGLIGSETVKHFAQDGQAVGVGEAVVEEDEIDTVLELFEGGVTRGRLEHVVALRAKPLAQRPSATSASSRSAKIWTVTRSVSRPNRPPVTAVSSPSTEFDSAPNA